MRIHTLVLAGAVVAAGCAGLRPGATASADLRPTQGNNAAGTVRFAMDGSATTVTARVSGLAPNGEFGFHIHEKGDCSSADATSAGGHFDPTGKPHGPQDADHHAGDMPSLRSDASGVANARFRLSGLSIGSGATDIVGKAVIVHAMPDDYKTQPAGNAGARIACGVIRAG